MGGGNAGDAPCRGPPRSDGVGGSGGGQGRPGAGCVCRLREDEPVVRVAGGRAGRSGVGGDVRSDYGGLAGPMSKALKTVGLVLGGVALVATGIGAIAGAGTFLGVAGSTFSRSEERRGGKEWVSKCRSRWSPFH